MMIVVEDDDGVRGLTKELLLDHGYDVITAENGTEGLARIESEPRLSIVITDIRMPGIDGWELARRAREVRPDIKVLYITGYPGEQLPGDAPAGPLLRKPWRAGEFYRCVEQLAGSGETRRADSKAIGP
jgi:CheY-like chemotaxis protein